MTGPPPPPPDDLNEPYRQPQRPPEDWHWVDDLVAMEVRAHLGSVKLDRKGRFRVAVPSQLRLGMSIDLLVVLVVVWIAWRFLGLAGAVLLIPALAALVLNCCVLQGLTGRSVGKWSNRTQLTYVAKPAPGPPDYGAPYFAIPDISRCAIRLLTQIVLAPVLFRVRQSGTVWSTLADDLNAVVILSPPVHLRWMQEGDQRDYQMLPTWERRERDRRDRRDHPQN